MRNLELHFWVFCKNNFSMIIEKKNVIRFYVTQKTQKSIWSETGLNIFVYY